MSKKNLNYALDTIIGLAFVLSAVTGIAFLLMGSGGYQGGRNSAFATSLWGISRTMWSDLHTLTSIVMIVGIIVHVVLHWNWIVCTTKGLFKPRAQRAAAPAK
jgi:hypothetical protein